MATIKYVKFSNEGSYENSEEIVFYNFMYNKLVKKFYTFINACMELNRVVILLGLVFGISMDEWIKVTGFDRISSKNRIRVGYL